MPNCGALVSPFPTCNPSHFVSRQAPEQDHQYGPPIVEVSARTDALMITRGSANDEVVEAILTANAPSAEHD